MTPHISLVPQLLPPERAFSRTELALLDELYEQAELDAICDALFADVLDTPR
jgi:hypothetical protein